MLVPQIEWRQGVGICGEDDCGGVFAKDPALAGQDIFFQVACLLVAPLSVQDPGKDVLGREGVRIVGRAIPQ